jgi:ferredoxin-NADP reductase
LPSLSSSTRRTRPAGSALGRLVEPLVQPGIFDFWVGHLNPAWSWERPLARVVERRVEAADTVTLVLKPNRHCGSFKPGQHVNLSAEVNGRRVTRSYSYTGTPQTKGPNKGLLSFTIKRTEGGRLSTHLCRDLREGDVLELGEAFGEMTLPAQPQGQWLFLAAGSGITPLMSLTRALVAQQMPVDLTLIYWAKTRAELCFLLELRQLAASQPRFKLHTVLTHEAQLLACEHRGFISAEQLQELVGDLSAQQVYACGPGGFVDTARELTAGIARSFMAEGFTPSAPAVDPSELKDVRVTLLKSGRELTVSNGTSLLDALEAQGLNPKSGCRMGICHSCVCTKHSGTVQDMHTKDIDAEGDTPVRICVSRATTDVSLDL